MGRRRVGVYYYDLSWTVLEFARRWCGDTCWGRIPSQINPTLLSVSVGASLAYISHNNTRSRIKQPEYNMSNHGHNVTNKLLARRKHDIGGEKISASVSSSQLKTTTRDIHLDVSSDRTKNAFSEDEENKPPPHDNTLSLITNAKKLAIPILYPPSASEQESFDTNLKVSIAHEKKWKLQPRRACINNKKQLLLNIKQTSTSIKPTLTSPPPPVDDASWANFLFGALHTPVPLIMPPPQITQGILHSPPEFNRVISIEDNNNTSILQCPACPA